MAAPAQSRLVEEALAFAEEAHRHFDASHDMDHIRRVVSLCRRIWSMRGGGSATDETVMLLSAVLHDVEDEKYSAPAAGGGRGGAVQGFLSEALSRCGPPPPPEQQGRGVQGRVEFIIRHVSWQKERRMRDAGVDFDALYAEEPCLAIVQDADRLDAVGALGIARCFTYGATRSRPLYSKASLRMVDEWEKLEGAEVSGYSGPGDLDERCDRIMSAARGGQAGEGDSLEHFFDKLLRLNGRLRTEEGRRIGEERQAFQVQFLKQLRSECQV